MADAFAPLRITAVAAKMFSLSSAIACEACARSRVGESADARATTAVRVLGGSPEDKMRKMCTVIILALYEWYGVYFITMIYLSVT